MSHVYKMPGQLIEELLRSRGWTQRVLAIVLGASETGINKIIAGKQSVDADLALALEGLFGAPASQFLDLQKEYDLAQARIIERPDPGRTTRAHLFGGLPIVEMIRRGWLEADDVRDVPMVESALIRFFGVASLDDIEILPHAAKKTSVTGDATPVQLAWLYRVKAIASEMLVPKYSPDAVRDAVGRLSALREAPEETRKIPRILAESGIRFVMVESLAGAKIDGVCLWLHENAPVIGMTLRYDRLDNFWFVLRHELEHVLLAHGLAAAMLDAELEGERAGTGASVTEEERVANEAAAEFCVPKRSMDSFIARKAPVFAERDVIGFARTIHVHPSLVVGQLQHRTGRFSLLRAHQVKIRSTVAPGAVVDGWGDVAPVGL